MNAGPSQDGRAPVKTVSYKIGSFIRSFTHLEFAAMGMAVVGLIMKFTAVTGGSYVFVFAMAMLALLYLIQIGLSFFYVVSNVRLALLGSMCSVALVLGFMALIFRYQNWYGWQVTSFIALPVFLVTAYFIFNYFRKRHALKKQHRTFLFQNLVVPYLFILILTAFAAFADTDRFKQQSTDRLDDSPLKNSESSDTTGMWRAY